MNEKQIKKTAIQWNTYNMDLSSLANTRESLQRNFSSFFCHEQCHPFLSYFSYNNRYLVMMTNRRTEICICPSALPIRKNKAEEKKNAQDI